MTVSGYAIDFIPPIIGIKGEFNTFRLGLFFAKRLKVDDIVYLMNVKEKLVFGRAVVTGIVVGPLEDMVRKHAKQNHAMLSNPGDREVDLLALLTKFYGPHIATPNKKTTVVYLRRIDDGEEI